jgi:transposase-like protein
LCLVLIRLSSAAGRSSWPINVTPMGNRLQLVAKTAEELGISDSCLRNWKRPGRGRRRPVPGPTSEERKELVELRRRNRVLEMENEIFKRASAYFAKENVLPKPSWPAVATVDENGMPGSGRFILVP